MTNKEYVELINEILEEKLEKEPESRAFKLIYELLVRI